jgi:transcriptional regulator with XRE-family HTH domain
MAQVHIGKKIKEVLKQSGMKSKDFASAINLSRTNIYSIFRRQTVDTGLLKQISRVLNHNFFDYLGQELPMVKDEKSGYVKKTDLLASMSSELKAYKKQLAELEKKYELLEKVYKLTEEKLKKKTGKS